MEEMKPCPFCGSKDISVKSRILSHETGKDCPCSSTRTVLAYCNYCGCTGRRVTSNFVGNEEIIAVATQAWNRRFNI